MSVPAVDMHGLGAPTEPSSAALRRGAGMLVACVAGIAYFVALHALVVTGTEPVAMLALVLAPWFVAGAGCAIGAARAGRIAVFVVIACALAAAAWVCARHAAAFAHRAEVVLLCENVAFFAWLSALFGNTLVGDREPLVTRLARKVRKGDMPASVVRYTRRVTAAWTLLFLAEPVVSIALFAGASREAWSTFVNLLVWPIVALAFVIEYAIRRAVLTDVKHSSIVQSIRAFRARADLDR